MKNKRQYVNFKQFCDIFALTINFQNNSYDYSKRTSVAWFR